MNITTLQLPNYQTTEQIYDSNRTVVYRGISSVHQKPVVIKILKKDYPTFNEILQFRNQYTITKNLDVAGIVKPINLETYGNSLALIMEDDGSISLSEELKSREAQNLSLEEFFSIAIQLAEILEGLYKNRVIHKDIKPANILINLQTKQVKLIDFSIASLLPKEQQEIQNPNILEGTLAYISPEQTGRMNRGIDYRSDYYSLGVTFYQLLTGKLPFKSDDAMKLVHCHLATMPPKLGRWGDGEVGKEKIPQMVSDIVMKLMAKNAEDRYQSALGLKYDLQKCWQQWQETGDIEPFELGERDIGDRFLVPEKLYGRATEVKTLLEAFERVANGSSEIMLVAGFSGIGKTVVINEVHKPIVKQRGSFIQGKFDQVNRNIPFSAFVQALRDLMAQLLGESDAELSNWKTKILKALGENAQVLIKVIPELESIIGQQPPIPELSGIAAQNRFNLLFQKFIATFTTPEHPLVMFLDDLQWADSASLNLIKVLMGDHGAGYLLLLGAYRDNEVSPAHPLMLSLAELAKKQAVISTITLQPLALVHVNQLVADTLSCSKELAQPLSKLIYQKTKGNPFFTTQFLKGLYEDELITFQLGLGYWECDLVKVGDAALAEDVVEFMAGRLQKLPEATQNVLKLAACIGNQFEIETLAVICQESEEKVARDIWVALQEGLVLPISEAYKFFQGVVEQATAKMATVAYRFLHDRLQQAAYSLIPDKQKDTTHYQIGQLLLQKIPKEATEDRIFELVSQLNYGTALITEQAERDELAQLNLMACRKARVATAYQAGREYVSVGLSLLGENPWQRQYQMTLAFHELGAELASLCGDFEAMEPFFETVIANAHSLLEQVNVYQIKIQAHNSQNQFSQAIVIAQQFLQELGVTFPQVPTPQDIQQEIQEIGELIGEREIKDLVHLPMMKDQTKLAIVQIASSINSATYLSGSPLFPLLILLSAKLSIQYGNTAISASTYASYGILLGNILQDIDAVTKFGQLALQVVSKLGAKAVKPPVLLILGIYILHRTSHLKEILSILQEGYTTGLEVGNLEFAGANLQNFCCHSFWCGLPLVTLAQDTRASYKQMTQLNQLANANYCRIYLQPVLNLLGTPEHPSSLSGEVLQQEQLLLQLQDAHDLYGLYIFHVYKLMLCYLFGEIAAAQNHALESKGYLRSGAGLVTEAVLYFYESLTILAASTPESKSLEQVEQNQTKLQQQWANHAPMNHQHKVDLVEAEKYRVLGKPYKALELYDRAIAGAKENEYIQEQALGNELAAKFHLNWGKEKIAAVYMQEAYYCYAHWGAKAKVEQLQKDYSQLLTPILQPRQEEQSQQMPETLTLVTTSPYSLASSQTSLSESLDLSTVLKASQSLSQEIHLDRLLCLIMEVIVTNAGANEGTLLWLKEDDLVIAAHYYQKDKQCKIPNAPLEQYSNLPLSIINTVKRSQQAIIVNQSQIETRWANDPYLRQHQPQSCLCMPVLQQGKLLALLYLENQLTPGVFSKSRLEMLTMLTSQAAISLENAQLYQTLEEKVKQRTRELEAAQKQIISQEKLASLGALTAGVAHELRNPLNFVNNYAEGSVELATELIEALETPDSLNQDDFDYLQEIATDLKDNAGAIQKHGQRAERIIYNMMQHSRRDDNSCQLTDINKLLDEARQLAYHSRRSRDNSFNVTFATQYDESVGELEVFSASLNRAFINLIDNACYAAWSQYLKQGEAFVPQLWITSQNLGEEIEIRIRDNGVGIPSEAKEKVFEPFFTTKPTGEGTGLGLSLTHEIIVGQHGGTLRLESKPGSFTEFILILPKKHQ